MSNQPVIHMVPGPVSVPARIIESMCQDYDTGRIKMDFIQEYRAAGEKLARLMGTKNDVVLMSGEAMVVLWGAFKSCLKPGDRVLCVDTGVFGAGFADMGRSMGCNVRQVTFDPDTTINSEWAITYIEDNVKNFRPKMIVAVHCDTPSGTINPLEGLGDIKRRYKVPLLAVDAVASVGAMPLNADDCGIDILMGGSQKALSAPPCMGFASVSPRAWEEIQAVGYAGYDAFLPFYNLKDGASLPYTPFRQGTAALDAAASLVLEEGLDKVFERHCKVAELCREGIKNLGLELFPREDALCSPTCTSVKLPANTTWQELRGKFMTRGLVAGGGLGFLEGKLFRLGHMGSQADEALVKQALAVIGEAL